MMPRYVFALVLLAFPVAASSLSTVEDEAQEYRKRIHPPLVRMIRSLEDELQSLSRDNSQSSFSDEAEQDFPPVTESSDIHFERSVDDFSRPADAFVPTSVVGETNDGNKEFMNNPAATEYQPASTSTPQFPGAEKTASPPSMAAPDQPEASQMAKSEVKSSRPINAAEPEDDEDSGDEDDANDDDDDDEEDDDDDEEEEDEEEQQEDRQHPQLSTEPPAYFKDVFFLAKEEKHEQKVAEETAKTGQQDGRTKIAEDGARPEQEKVSGQAVAAEPSDVSPEQNKDATVSDLESQQGKKEDDNTDAGNKNDNNDHYVDNNNYRNSSSKESEAKTESVVAASEEAPRPPATTQAAPAADQYNYNAANDDASLEIDITADDESQESSEIDRDAGNAGNYGAGNVSSPAADEESDKARLEEEILERLRSEGAQKRLVKKSMPRHSHPGNRLRPGRDSAENEDILQLMIRVAEDPKDWEEIRELLEKIQFDETTLRKAKSRLRALAKQQRLKNIRKNKTKGHDHVKHKLGKLLSRNFENDVNAVPNSPKPHANFQGPRKAPSAASSKPKGTNKTQGTAKVALSKQKVWGHDQMRGNGKDGGYIKVNVYPAANEKAQAGPKSDKYHQGNGRNRPQAASSSSSMRIKGDDFAIEKPVTVIGERSRVDPVEKELVEASTNQRIREIHREKAMLAAAGLPTDEMEEQLKALTKLERRLKEHWHQKQKLLQKIHEKDQRRQAEGPSVW